MAVSLGWLDRVKYRGKRKAKPELRPQPEDRNLIFLSLRMITNDPALQLTPTALKAILDDAAEGDAQEQAALIDEMTERDSRLEGVFAAREEAALACDWDVRPVGMTRFTDKDEKPEIKELREMLQNAGIEDLLSHLVRAGRYGYQGSYIDWGDGGGKIHRFIPAHPTAWIFDEAGNPALKDMEGHEQPLSKLHPNQYVFHRIGPQNMLPTRFSMGRNLAWIWYFKNHCLKSWNRYLEKFGVPFLIAKVTKAEFDDKTTRANIIKQLRSIARDGVFITTSEGGVDSINEAASNGNVHEKAARYLDQCYAIGALGQLATSEGEPGKLGTNPAQNEVKIEKKQTDCRRLMQTIRRDIIVPYWTFKYGDPAGAPGFFMNYMRPRDTKARAETFEILARAGYRVSQRQVENDCNLEIASVSDPLATRARPLPTDSQDGREAKEDKKDG